MIKIYDDLLPDPRFILRNLLSTRFNWKFGGSLVPSEELLCDELDNYQLANLMYDNMVKQNDEFDIVREIIHHKDLNIAALIRVKANLNPRTSSIITHGFHVDFKFPCTTAIYYANTCNGYTEFEDGTKIESIANRMVTFPSSFRHSSTTCTDQKARLVINFNYFTKI